MAELTTRHLPVLPLPAGVVLPGMVVTIALESDEARTAADAVGEDRQLLLVPRLDRGYAAVGVVATIEDRGALPDGTPALVIRAERRAVLGAAVVGTGGALLLAADPVEDPATGDEPELADLARQVRAAMRALLEARGGPRLAAALPEADDPAAVADLAGWWPDLALERKVELLETTDVAERLRLVLAWTRDELAEAEVADGIRRHVAEGLESDQREAVLRRQLAAIRAELGEGTDDDDAVAAYRQAVDEGDLPDEVATAARREIDRLERTPAQNVEHGWIRSWLDALLEVPWGQHSPDDLDLVGARAVLDADHHGLDEAKDRVVEHLAVRKLRGERAVPDDGDERVRRRGEGAILALVGPPGVGKTSLGESIARAMGRRFVRIALGGVRDEAEIRGHRRTYGGAKAGRIATALAEAGTMNPVVLLDEIDKVGADWRGDPSSALLEVLDPAQNHTFRDHYLEVDLDLSDVLFLATANVVDTIPGPLLDRLEVLRVDGYTDDEKVAIARDHLVPRQLERNGLTADDATVTDDALRAVVDRYTHEAGVRELERQLGRLLRKAAARIAGAPTPPAATPAPPDAPADGPVAIGPDDLTGALGRPRVRRDEPNRQPVPGVVNGLAVTGAGGDVLVIEATAMEGEPGLTLTGQLGDVMTESGGIARSYLRANRERLGVQRDALDRHLHVHVPAGAVPKDGPSAGITMTTALVSALSGRPVRPEVGMTGEVTLQGKVLPIGGLKQKLLAAHRAGLRTVIVPAANEPDLEDVPAAVLDELDVHPVADVADVLELALLPAPAA